MLIEITYNVTDVYMSTTETPVYVEISFEQPGGTSAVWGSITGTLSNQTDLQNALNAKFDDPTGTTAQYLRGDGSLATFPSLTGYVPYTGATTNVDLGEYELKAGQLTLDTSPTGTAAVGTTRWNDTTGLTETTLKGGNVILKNGVDLVARVVNKVSPNTTLTKAAYQAVRVSGAQGQRLAVALAQANNDANSADTIGLVTETIATNQEGFIMTVGQLENINTTGSLQGETWVDGDVLYLSPTTAGAITKVKPTGNGHIVVIGYVEYAHANNGKIYVKVMNGWELDELHDVAIVTPLNNEALIYESSSALWKNKSIPTALGYTPANAATTLTINGVTYDLSTSRTWTVAAGISGTIATGQVAYATAANTIGGSNNLFWDNTNSRLGIGTNAPANSIDILTNQNSAQFAQIKNNSTGSAAQQGFVTYNNNNEGGGLVSFGSAFSNVPYRNNLGVISTKGIIFGADQNVTSGGTSTIQFITGGFSIVAAMTLNSLGRLSLGTTSDLGVRLGVVGDTLLRGSGNTSATTALTVQNSASAELMSISNDAAANRLNITGSSTAYFKANQTTANRFVQFGSNATTADFYVGSGITSYIFTNNIGFGLLKINTAPFPTAGGNVVELPLINSSFAPTSGTAELTLLVMRPLINQTGGANGITRGLYVNPTLTAAADFRAIETSAGNVLFGSNFFWDNTNSRLGIGTNAPVGQLNVNQVAGTTKGILISGDEIFATGNGVADKGVRISVGVNRLANRQLWIGDSDAFGSATASIFRYQTGQTGYASLDSVTGDGITRLLTIIGTETSNVGIGSNALTPTTAPYTSKLNVFTLNTSNSNLQLRKFGTATGNYLDIVNTSGTTIAFLNNSGNLNIGTTDLGVRLGVVGDTILRGSGATSTTTALTVQNSSSTNLFTVRNDGLVSIPSTVYPLLSLTSSNTIGGGFQLRATATGGRMYTFLATANGAGQGAGKLIVVDEDASINRLCLQSSGNFCIGTTTDISSAILIADSTTKGFLPPRMTTTQKNAISSPAAGLVVYDTTLNKLCVYTTAWETITSI